MNRILRNKHKRVKALVVALFLVAIFLFGIPDLLQPKTASASAASLLNTISPGASTATTVTPPPGAGAGSGAAAAVAQKAADAATTAFEDAIQKILEQVQSLVILLFGAATTLFAWVIDPNNVSGANGMLNKQAVKDVWVMVRDLLNMTFILILLFAAFCTIFQVEKWNLKKVWLNILINALLVNFSFPIARFIIDISNVAFYYFVNNLFSPATAGGTVSGSSIFSGFAAASALGGTLTPPGFATEPIAYQIAIIIVLFIMGMTLLIIAALFVVRLIALTMIVMFSPIGFVGYIFPGTHSFADKWWKNLFSYSFFAPIMIFVMNISLRIMQSLQAENFQDMMTKASTNSNADQTSFIASTAFYVIPVLILWMGMGIAKSSGIAMADKVVGGVQSGGKTLGSWLAYKNPVARGVIGGVKEKTGVNAAIKWWKSPSKTEAAIKGGIIGIGKKEPDPNKKGGMLGGATNALKKLQYDEIRDAVEEHKKNQTSHSQLALDLKSTNDVKKKAAAVAMAERDEIRNAADFELGLKALEGDENLTSKFIQKGVSAVKDPENLKKAIIALKDDNKSISTLIEKVGAGTLKMESDVYAGVVSSIKDDGMKGQLEARMKKEGHSQTLVEYMVNHAAPADRVSYDQAYEKTVGNMSPADLAKQKESLHKSTHFANYVANNSGAQQSFNDTHRKNTFSEMSGNNQRLWFSNGIHP